MHKCFATVVCLSLLLAGIGGCASSTSGTSALSADKANQIQKGVTTQSQVEAMFGPPANISMMPDGKRMMSYYFNKIQGHAGADTYIPVVDWFSSSTNTQTETRTLQVMLDTNNIVQDYQYNDNSSNTESRGGLLGGSVNSTATTNPSSAN